MNACIRILLAAFLLLSLSASISSGQPSVVQEDVPPSFKAMVPEGAKLGSSNASHSAMNDLLALSAIKTFPNSNDSINYSVTMTCFAPKYWQALKPSYQTMVTQSIESARRSMAKAEGWDQPQVVTHSWGGGVIQRHETKESSIVDGPGDHRGKITVQYDCRYYGIVGSSIFECRVRCTGSPENVGNVRSDAEHWADKVAEQAANTSFGIFAK